MSVSGTYLILSILLYTTLSSSVDSSDIVLTDENFTESIGEAGPNARWFVKFHSPMHPVSTDFFSIWKEVTSIIHSRPDSNFRVAQVDSSKSKGLSAAFNIKYYPTVKLIANGQYLDVRDASTLEDYQEIAHSEDYKGFTMKNLPSQEDIEENAKKAKLTNLSINPTMSKNAFMDMTREYFYSPMMKLMDNMVHNTSSTILIIVFGMLLGILLALIVCFRSPYLVYVQDVPSTTKKSTSSDRATELKTEEKKSK